MSMNDQGGYLTTGNPLIVGFLHSLSQFGRSDAETVLALARVVLWILMYDPEEEDAEMKRARKLMRNGAAAFKLAAERPAAAVEIEGSGREMSGSSDGVNQINIGEVRDEHER